MNTLKVAVNVNRLSVSGLINKARLVTQRITDNPNEFSNCTAANARATQAITALESAEADARDGARSKVALMHDRKQELINLMGVLGSYIEEAANGDPAIVHLAGLDVKKKGTPAIPEFRVATGEHAGTVSLKVKARDKTVYKWQYCQGVTASGPWTDGARSSGSKALISGLAPGIYWFRVVFVDGTGEHEQSPLSFAVN